MKTWNEKNAFEKALDVISGIALVAWLIFAVLENNGTIDWQVDPTMIAATIICICQTFSFWNEKRVLSYVAIAGIICMVAVIVLQFM